MNELSKVVNAQLQQAAENLVRNRLMSDEFLDFVQENTKPLAEESKRSPAPERRRFFPKPASPVPDAGKPASFRCR